MSLHSSYSQTHLSHVSVLLCCLSLVLPEGQEPALSVKQQGHTDSVNGIMKEYSRFVVVVDNLSSSTPTKDIEYEFGYAGRIRWAGADLQAVH
jgi:hypothetical protein